MKFVEQKIPGLYVIEPDVFKDERGAFRRGFCSKELEAIPGGFEIKQTNISENFKKNTLRGFHFQAPPYAEDRILTVMTGALYNVTVDFRKNSPMYRKWIALELYSSQRKSVLVPKGCANAFLTLEDMTTVLYYMSEFYSPENSYGFRYNDPFFEIKWPQEPDIISDKDINFPDFEPQRFG